MTIRLDTATASSGQQRDGYVTVVAGETANIAADRAVASSILSLLSEFINVPYHMQRGSFVDEESRSLDRIEETFNAVSVVIPVPGIPGIG